MIEINYLFILISILLYICMIVWHEFGHWFMLKHYTKRKIVFGFDKKRLSFTVGKMNDYKKLSNINKVNIYFIGIMSGFFPFFFFSIYLSDWINLFVFLGYIFGCVPDLKKIEACGGLKQLFKDAKVV